MIMDKQVATRATWDISLDCECPGCKEYVDLLDFADFWDGRSIEPIEHDTPSYYGSGSLLS